jgi:type II secretory pathway pseudopilin PulG
MLWLWIIPKPKNRCLLNLGLVLAVVLILSALLIAQQSGQKTFATPEEASQALFAAAQAGDPAALLEIFGPAGSGIVSSGDSVQDNNTRHQFVDKYQEMHRLVQEPNGTTTLYIGAENWPVPVPLVNKAGVWFFDTETGAEDVLFRRIGHNEYAVIDVCHALVDAQNEYYSQSRDGRVQQYARAFASDEGQHNGLFWKTAGDEPESPIGPLVADAAAEGYRKPEGEESSPFHGYYFRILTGQGKTAQGGAKSYIVNGAMTGGFAILAYPADYRSSGVMTFIVSQSGVIYQKDLGPKTSEIASALKEYTPDKTWRRAE